MNIFITGISRGIGHSLARKLSEKHTIYGTSRSKIDTTFNKVNHKQCDINSKQTIEFIKEIPQIDIAILNAGILGEVALLKDQSIEQIIKVNCLAQKQIIDHLLEKKCKHIYAISSGAAKRGLPGWGGYAISKAAFKMMIEVYSKESPNTHFLNIAPGLINTSMQDYLCDEADHQLFPNLARLKEARKTGSMISPDEFANRFEQKIQYLSQLETGSFIDFRDLY